MFAGMKSLLSKLFIPAILLLSACTGSEETGKSKASATADTVITVTKDGKKLQLTVPVDRSLIKDVLEIDSLMQLYKGKPLEKEIRSLTDVTGDSIPEEVTARVRMDGDTCRVNHTIRSAGKIIWDRSLKIGRDYALINYSDTAFYDKLWPYSGFATGLDYTVVADHELKASDFAANDVTLSLRRNELKQRGLDDFDAQEEMIRFKKYLKEYKGALVYGLDLLDGGLYIWYEPEKKLILLYAP